MPLARLPTLRRSPVPRPANWTLYAGKWVVRPRRPRSFLHAGTFDELATKRKSGRFKDGDKILRLPPPHESISQNH